MSEDLKSVKIAIAVVVLILLVFVLVNSVHHVPIGMVGIDTKMSKVTGKIYDSGWYFKMPFITSIKDMSIRNDSIVYNETQGELSGQETIYMSIVLVYSLNREKAADVYVNYGKDFIYTLMPQQEVFDIIKGTVAKYSIDEFASKRDAIFEEAKNNLNNRMSERGIQISTVSLSDYHFTNEMEAAISQKNKATLERKTQEEINQKNISQAEAEAQVKEKKAQGEANAIRTKADAEAYANQKINDSLTDNIVKLKAIEAFKEKWNGEYPKIVDGDSNMLFDINDFLNR